MSKLLPFFLFFSLVLHAQIISGNIAIPPSQYSSQVYDVSVQNIYYQLNFVNNPKLLNNRREVVCLLAIGRSFSRFGELNTLKYDSLAVKFSTLSTVGAKEINQMFPVMPRWKTIILKNETAHTNIIQDIAKDTYQYTEEFPKFDWKIESKTKEILGYQCQMATMDFSGRKYTAWFAKELPINNGPYIFNDLPGLIMEIGDNENHFHFLAIALDKSPQNIYLRNEKKIFQVTREQFRTVQKSYHDNPGFYHCKAYNENGSELSIKSKPLPYNPLELE